MVEYFVVLLMRRATRMCGAALFILVVVFVFSVTALVNGSTLNDNISGVMKRGLPTGMKLDSSIVVNGDWNITSYTTFKDGVVVVNGRIFVKDGGTLVLRNAVVYMNSSYDGEFWVEVYDGGFLILDNATITAYDPNYRFYVKLNSGSKFVMDNGSEISLAGFSAHEVYKLGVWINTDNVTISKSKIEDCYEIYIYNVTNLTLKHTKICYCSEIRILKSNNITIENNVINAVSNGLSIGSSYGLAIKNNTILDSTYDGIDLTNVNNTKIEFNIINNTRNGISATDCHNLVFRGNTIAGNDYGIKISDATDLVIRDDDFLENSYGICVEQAFNVTIQENNVLSSKITGIKVAGSSNVTVKENYVDNAPYGGEGIELSFGENNSVVQNVIKGCETGLFILSDNNTYVSGNTLMLNPIIVYANTKNEIAGLTILEDNTLNGHPIRYFYDINNSKLTGGTIGEILVLYSENVTIVNVIVHTFFIGYSTNVSASYISAENSTYGIYVTVSHYITIENSYAQKNRYGVYLSSSDHITIAKSFIKNNDKGIYIDMSQCVDFRENTVSSNSYGMDINDLDDSVISANIFIFNSRSFVIDSQSDNLTFYLNDFLFDEHASVDDGANRFDNGTIGNYWLRYTGLDSDGDGIGDTPYYIDSDSVDRYPLMKPHRFEDNAAPVIHGVTRIPEQPNSSETVTIYANITDNIRVKTVILSYYNGSAWTNITMIHNETTGLYVGVIPNLPQNTTVQYKIYAVDYSGNWVVSDTYSYTVAVELQEKPQYPILTALIYALAITVVAMVVALMVLKFKRRKTEK